MTTRHTAAGTECTRCHRDTHSPKAYSRENNMHPGPVPMELLVIVHGHCLWNYTVLIVAVFPWSVVSIRRTPGPHL